MYSPRVVFPVNYVSTFCMELCVSGRSHVRYIYMIGQEHNHVVLLDHASLSQLVVVDNLLKEGNYENEKDNLGHKMVSLGEETRIEDLIQELNGFVVDSSDLGHIRQAKGVENPSLLAIQF